MLQSDSQRVLYNGISILGKGHIETRGEVRVEPFIGTSLTFSARVYLLVGPTGAGKSSFIESLAGKSQALSISKDQLEGYTQTVTIYELVNAFLCDKFGFSRDSYPVYLVDTPGFSDSKISELEVMDMIRNRLSSVGVHYVHRIFFFIPINIPRLAGSRRRTIDMFKVLLRSRSNDITFVTSMWDALHKDGAHQRAESNFAQLRDQILADCIAHGAAITCFTNKKQPPEEMLPQLPSGGYGGPLMDRARGVDPHGLILYQDLIDRIKSGLLKQKNIDDDLDSLDAEAFPELQAIQERNCEENQELLWKFFGQYLNFIDPPAQFASATFDLDKTIIDVAGYLDPPSPYKDLLEKYNDEDRDHVRRNWSTLHQYLRYVFNGEEVKSALQEKEMTELDLALLDNETNSEAKAVLEQRQVENQQVLMKVIAQWLRAGDPPAQIHTVTRDIRKSVIAFSDLIRLHSAYEDVFFLWEHAPSWAPSFEEQPEDTGVFTPTACTGLKIRRKNYEARYRTLGRIIF